MTEEEKKSWRINMDKLLKDIDETLHKAIRHEAYTRGYSDGRRGRPFRWWRANDD